MVKWHETAVANIALRMGGLVFCTFAWVLAHQLSVLIRTNTSHPATVIEFLLAALLFVSGSVGSGFVLSGPNLWKEVRISERWTPRISIQ